MAEDPSEERAPSSICAGHGRARDNRSRPSFRKRALRRRPQDRGPAAGPCCKPCRTSQAERRLAHSLAFGVAPAVRRFVVAVQQCQLVVALPAHQALVSRRCCAAAVPSCHLVALVEASLAAGLPDEALPSCGVVCRHRAPASRSVRLFHDSTQPPAAAGLCLARGQPPSRHRIKHLIRRRGSPQNRSPLILRVRGAAFWTSNLPLPAFYEWESRAASIMQTSGTSPTCDVLVLHARLLVKPVTNSAAFRRYLMIVLISDKPSRL